MALTESLALTDSPSARLAGALVLGLAVGAFAVWAWKSRPCGCGDAAGGD